MTTKFLVVFEKEGSSFGAFAPDIPGCIAVGKSLEEVRARFLDAVKAHLASMAADDESLPEPKSKSFEVPEEDANELSKSFFTFEWLPIEMPQPVHSPLA